MAVVAVAVIDPLYIVGARWGVLYVVVRDRMSFIGGVRG